MEELFHINSTDDLLRFALTSYLFTVCMVAPVWFGLISVYKLSILLFFTKPSLLSRLKEILKSRK